MSGRRPDNEETSEVMDRIESIVHELATIGEAYVGKVDELKNEVARVKREREEK